MSNPKISYPSAKVSSGPFTTLLFSYPPRKIPGFFLWRYGQDTLSSAGLQQSITQLVDQVNTLNVETMLAGSDLAAWQAFCNSAILRTAFDYYPDASQSSYVTYIDMDDQLEAAYKAPGIYTLKMKWRQYIS